MTDNFISFGNLRNITLYSSQSAAIQGLESANINDGVIKLARYTDEDGSVKTVFGVAYTSGETTTYTVYNSFKEVIDDLQDQINAITGGSESVTVLIERAINELKGDVTEDYDTLGEIEAIIKANKTDGIVTLESRDGESGSTIAKTYTIKQGGVYVGSFDIFKDSFLKAVYLIDKDGHIIPEGDTTTVAQAIQFVFVMADGSEKYVNISMASFIQDIEAGDGLIVDANGVLHIIKANDSEDFLRIDPDSIAIVGVQDAIDAAVATLNSELSAALEAETSRAISAETALDEKIDAEIERAISAETSIDNKLTVETERAKTSESYILQELNKIAIKGIYGVSATTDNNRVTTLQVVVDDNPFIETSPLTVESTGLKFATELDCGYFDVDTILYVNSNSDLSYMTKGDYNLKMVTNVNAYVAGGIFAKGNCTLDLNGKTISGSRSDYPVFYIKGTQKVTFEDKSVEKEGKIVNPCNTAPVIWCDSVSGAVINGGNYISQGHSEVIYVTRGTLEINGGTFRSTQDNENRYILNCLDSTYASGVADIIVKGGKFYNFNPQDCESEGAHTNFVADGYQSIQLENEIIDGIEYQVFEVIPN